MIFVDTSTFLTIINEKDDNNRTAKRFIDKIKKGKINLTLLH